jgi:hypothetical protein
VRCLTARCCAGVAAAVSLSCSLPCLNACLILCGVARSPAPPLHRSSRLRARSRAPCAARSAASRACAGALLCAGALFLHRNMCLSVSARRSPRGRVAASCCRSFRVLCARLLARRVCAGVVARQRCGCPLLFPFAFYLLCTHPPGYRPMATTRCRSSAFTSPRGWCFPGTPV